MRLAQLKVHLFYIHIEEAHTVAEIVCIVAQYNKREDRPCLTS